MVEKGNLQRTKNKFAIVYYFLMIILGFFGLLIIFGLLTTEEIHNWWNSTIW